MKPYEKLNTIEELKEFAEAQYNVIQNQTKKIFDLTEQLEQEKAKPKVINTFEIENNTKDAETICLTQLKLLNAKSLITDLTLEETKKVETFTKTYLLLKGKIVEDKNKDKDQLKDKSTAKLLELVNINTKEQ